MPEETSVEEAVAQLQDAEAEAARINAIVVREGSKVAAQIAPLLSENGINITPASTIALGMLFASGAKFLQVEKENFLLMASEFFDRIAAPEVIVEETPAPSEPDATGDSTPSVEP